ncbi:FtsX-like permease family protein [Actinomycetospora sp. TBRC 11914]|uniref:FtsX-like permease family protein n=1 Tax=Actinomycetospora sp. TBRC 11914 TaxID=2729387 RepID=UPI00145E044C|nr:ABC transporter permease [Actinomycetospora sp. TBRC 11914]NMO90244.1 ABC transporter permease [Actinomycetospora sp. TBRC 11914]
MLRVAARSVAASKARMALSVVVVALGVGFVVATLVLSATINAAFTGLFTSGAADVTASPRAAFAVEVEDQAISGSVPTLPAAAVDAVARTPGVAAAHGEVATQDVTVVDAAGHPVGPASGAPTLGYNWYPRAHPIASLTAGHAPDGAGQVVLDAPSAAAAHLTLGAPVRLISPAATTPATLVGLADPGSANPGVGLVFLDTPTAQSALLGQPGRFTAVTADAAPGTTDAALAPAVQHALGATVSVATREQQASSAAARVGAFLSTVTYALLGIAAVALLVGSFLIVNTFTMLVAGRMRELGLLRAVGARRGQVTAMVLGEAVLVGLVGATVGLGAGIGLCAGLEAALRGFGIDLSSVGLVVPGVTVPAAYVLGIGVTVAAAYLPARRAGRAAPTEVLRESAAPTETGTGRGRVLAGTAVLLLAAASLLGAALLTPRTGDLTLGGGLFALGAAASLAGLVLIGPALARRVVSGLAAAYPRLFGAVGRLARDNAARAPRRTATTAAALTVGVALVTGLGILASSLDTSIIAETSSSLGADYVLSGRGGQPLAPQVTDAVRAVPGVASITRQRYAPAGFRGAQVSLSGVDTATLDAATAPQYVAGDTGAVARGQLDVDQASAAADGLAIGSPVHLTFVDGTPADLTVGAISKPPPGGGKDGSTFQVSLDTLSRYQPLARDFSLSVIAAPGAAAALGPALHQALASDPQVSIQNRADQQNALRGQVDLVLELLYGLLALAVVVAVLGVVNTLALSVIERRREIGLLRAVGATRAQIRSLIRLEALAVSLYGTVLGVALGFAWGAAGQRLLTGYGVTTLSVPWATVAALAVGGVLVGLVAAIAPARRAARADILAGLAAT